MCRWFLILLVFYNTLDHAITVTIALVTESKYWKLITDIHGCHPVSDKYLIKFTYVFLVKASTAFLLILLKLHKDMAGKSISDIG